MESNEIFGSTVKAETPAKKTASKKAPAKKATTKKAAETKAETPAKKAAEKTTETKKATTTKTTTTKATAAKKTTTKKSDSKKSVFIQFNGQQVDYDVIVKKVADDCKKQKVSSDDLTLYIKPEDNACYYVTESGIAGKVDLY